MKLKSVKRFAVCALILSVVGGILCFAQDMTKQTRLENTLYLQSNNYASAKDGVLTVIDGEDKTVMPKIIDGELYVPLRFVLESFGVTVGWNDSEKSVIVSGGGKYIFLSVKDDTITIENLTQKLDKDCFIENSRTYIAISDVSKLMKCHTHYYSSSKAAVIAAGEEWNPEREAEKQALSAMQFAVSPFFKMFT